ncbi:hypothetical protein BASA50_008843 [Batrachochytrium salamandrivorans]|uniref:Uncharacterized protein n=1 Tax=Batrachochytrium salamandrivorans TaxID=1357716 RepID=A0ABQ8F337_9FUNG|nr:hypothetical protein BASA50_008843 [Batrachochytrium salamandrivorans]KAH9268709.1 hypothetical protein BASA83_009192 [Batrachochytrium salamandrivorans]
MKLISFAVISFLAITVSAYPYQNPDERDLEESQGASFQSGQQPQGAASQILLENPPQSLQDKIDKLTNEYEGKQAAAGELQNEIDRLGEEMAKIESRVHTLDGSERTNLVRDFLATNTSWDLAHAAWEALQHEMEDIRKERGELVKQMALLNETQE